MGIGISCTIAVAPTAKATSLDIVRGEKETNVAVVTESCNSGNGYTVSLKSQNAGALSSKANGATPTNYEAVYDDGKGSINESITAYRDQAEFGRQSKLLVSFGGNEKAIAGEYADVIYLAIAAK